MNQTKTARRSLNDEEVSHAPVSRIKRRSVIKSVVLILIVAALAAPWLIGPPCPDRIVIATGPSDGAYFRFANEYRKKLAKQGITLEIRETAGSIENMTLLQSGEVGLAMVQGGIASSTTSNIQSLASLYQEPVWIFHRVDMAHPIQKISDLSGLHIAIGPKGSGVRSIALELLKDNCISSDSQLTKLSDDANSRAFSKLKSGQIDAAFFVISSDSSIVREMLSCDEIALLDISRAAAYQKRHSFLSKTTLPEGVINFHLNRPSTEKTLLAPTANLAVKSDFHHALVPQVLQAVQEVHQKSDQLLVSSVEFPSAKFSDFPLNPDARRFFKSGPSMLYRYFPFWVAAWLDRLKLILLPMLTLLIPFSKIAPPVYRWRIRSKIYRWYRVLHDIDRELNSIGERESDSTEVLSLNGQPDQEQYREFDERLKNLERELLEVTVPLSYMEEFYNLRIHVNYVKNKLHKLPSAYTGRSIKAA